MPTSTIRALSLVAKPTAHNSADAGSIPAAPTKTKKRRALRATDPERDALLVAFNAFAASRPKWRTKEWLYDELSRLQFSHKENRILSAKKAYD